MWNGILEYVMLLKTFAGDNTEKIWAHRFLAQPKAISTGCLGEAVSPPGVQGDALVKEWV